MPSITASVDIGGTFTDIIIQRGSDIIGFYKVPTTPREPEVGLSEGLQTHASGKISEIVHATTIATNALLGQYGLELPRVALLTTEGFRDVIEIGRQNRPSLYDLNFSKPRTLIPGNLRFEISERTDSKGRISRQIEEPDIDSALDKLKEAAPDSIAISLLNSHMNSFNEHRIRDVLSQYFSYISVSSEISPEQREYERTSTVVVNAALMPIMSRYMRNLNDRLKSLGDPGVSVMSSSGGLITTDEVFRRPVQMVESGPAAGVIASSEMSKLLGLGNVISFDMGGTTAKAGAVVNGSVSIVPEYEVGGKSHHGRMAKGSGYPVRFPFVDLAEVSAGGGTIIWKDSAGGLNVGPVSSGSDPGPVCYGKGGTEPTVSDANLVTGILGDTLLDGRMKLDMQAAIESLGKLGDPRDVAESAISLVNLEMARAIRIVTVERGLDPSDFTLMAFGGAGPQHAARIAEELGVGEVVIPPKPGLFSALGLLFSDWKYEARQSFPDDTEVAFKNLEEKLNAGEKRVRFLKYADCRYRGQGSELTVTVTQTDRNAIEKSFRELHESVFGFALDREVEIVTIRVFSVIDRDKPVMEASRLERRKVGERSAYIDGKELNLKVYWKNSVENGDTVPGPSSIEDYDTTVFVPSGWNALIGSLGEITLEKVG